MLSIILNEISNTIITDNSIKNKPNILQNALISKSYRINIILLCNAASFILQILISKYFLTIFI
jgi:hypothetical protein